MAERKVVEKNSLSVPDICTIIEVCAKHGVRKLKFASLEIELGQAHTVEPQAAPTNLSLQHQEMEIAEKEAVQADERSLKEALLATLQIENPLEYEEVLEKLEADGNAEFINK